MISFKMSRRTALVGAAAIGLTACGNQASNDPSGSAPAPSGSAAPSSAASSSAPEGAIGNFVARDMIKDGGTYTTELTEISTQFNTFHQDGTRYTLDVWRWYNPKLALFSPEGDWSFNDDYLTEFKDEVVDGKTRLTITFRDEAKFNDGTDMDWTCIEATWKTSNGTDETYKVSSTDGYNQITSVTQGGTAKTAVVDFEGEYAWWQGLFNVVLHPKAVDPTLYDTGYIEEPHNELGAGPYQVKSYDKNAGTIVFERNPNWWGDAGKLDERIFRAMEDSASINAFKNGEIDATLVGNAERYAQVQDMADITVYRATRPASSLIVLNSENGALTEPEVRHAFMMGLDRQSLMNVRFNGLDYTEPLPGSLSLFTFQTGYKDNLTEAGITYDAAAAQQILEDAGWVAGSDGIREKDGAKLNVLLPLMGDSQMTANLGAAVQAMMKQIGMDVTLETRPSSAFSDTITQKTFDLFMMGFASSDPFGMAYFGQIYNSDSELNKSGTGTAELDAKIAEADRIADPVEQTEVKNELEVEAFKTYGIIPTFNGPSMYAVKNGMANFDTEATGFYVGKPQDMGWLA